MFESSPILALLSRALDAASLRQAVHSTNLANAQVDNFHRLEVVFDAELQAAQGVEPRLEDVAWSTSEPTVVATNDVVRLDQEMALMAKDAVRYQALIGAVERTMGLLHMAARDGREG